MPFNVRCTGCDNQIGKGVRFNAEKKAVGRYLSTKIWSFRMMCHCEDNTWRTDRSRNPHFIEIHTDPKNAEYVVVEGAERVAEAKHEEAIELGVEALGDPEEAAKRAADPFHMLEATQPKEAKQQRAARGPWINALKQVREDDWADDYASSQLLRKIHRQKRHYHEAEAFINEAKGIGLELLPEALEDRAAAASAPLQYERRLSEVRRGEKRLRLMSGSIFGGDGSTAGKDEEERRLALLQMSRERGMRVTASKRPKGGGGGAVGPFGGAFGGAGPLKLPKPAGPLSACTVVAKATTASSASNKAALVQPAAAPAVASASAPAVASASAAPLAAASLALVEYSDSD